MFDCDKTRWMTAALALSVVTATAGCAEEPAKAPTCATANNGVCDEPHGTGKCPAGTDKADCTPKDAGAKDGSVACGYRNDGTCDEPQGTGYCPAGTDPEDCGQGGDAGAQDTASGGDAQDAAADSGAAADVGGGTVVAEVLCTKFGTPCKAGDVCCFHKKKSSLDTCGAKGSCGTDYLELACNGNEDCAGDQECCYVDLSDPVTLVGMQCADSCEPPSKKMCKTNADCAKGKKCDWLVPGYSSYMLCK